MLINLCNNIQVPIFSDTKMKLIFVVLLLTFGALSARSIHNAQYQRYHDGAVARAGNFRVTRDAGIGPSGVFGSSVKVDNGLRRRHAAQLKRAPITFAVEGESEARGGRYARGIGRANGGVSGGVRAAPIKEASRFAAEADGEARIGRYARGIRRTGDGVRGRGRAHAEARRVIRANVSISSVNSVNTGYMH